MLLPISRTGAPNQKGQRVAPLKRRKREMFWASKHSCLVRIRV